MDSRPTCKIDTIKNREENIENSLTSITAIFLDLSTRVMEIIAKINKWDLIKIYLYSKGNSFSQMKRKSPEWRKYLQMIWILMDQYPTNSKKLWKILKEMGILDLLNCLLRNLYAGQEVTVRTRQATTD